MEKVCPVLHTQAVEGMIENRKARFNYDIRETLEAGVELKGHEVKAIKTGKGDLTGSHVIIRGGEAWLVNAVIPPYQPHNTEPGYAQDRTRRLLLTKEEIGRLAGASQREGLTIVPLRFYIKTRRIKLSIGLGKGKKKADKRETIKKREWTRLRRNIETR